METIKSWILSVCGAILISSLAKIFLSKSKLRKTTNIFLSLFVLFYTVLPISNVSVNNFDNKYTYNEKSFDLNYKDGYDKIVVESIRNLCKEYKIEIISFDMDSYIDEDGYLVVNNLTIDISDKSRIIETESIIKQNLGFEVTVI